MEFLTITNQLYTKNLNIPSSKSAHLQVTKMNFANCAIEAYPNQCIFASIVLRFQTNKTTFKQ